jgi:excisionase family DNA binding protein
MVIETQPLLLTTAEVAALLRTSRKAVYAMVERGQLPGVVRIGRRVLVRRVALLDFLDHSCTTSPQEYRR